ncbi:unnamed protein product [Ectocarpus sp. 12 AP-2014]
MHVAMGSAAGCVRWAAVLTTSWVLVAPPPQSIAWLGPHATHHPSRRNHNFDASSSRRRPCSVDKPSRLHVPATPGRSLLGSAASDTQSPRSDLSAAAATTAASPPSPSLVPWYQARFSVTLPPPRGPDDRCRAVTKAVTNGLVPLLEGLTAGEGVGLLHVLNSTASLAVSPIPPTTTTNVQEAAGTVGATAVSPSPPSTAVALTIRDGSAVWGQGQELWMSLAQEEDTSGGGSGDYDALAKVQRGSARYDFLVLWCAPQHGDGVSPSGDVEATRVDGGLTPGIQTGAGGGDAERQPEARVEGGERGQGRGMGPSGGHVVGELRPLNEFSTARQEALDKALVTVGVDPRELTEADEFFGTAALKSYNTFVRPRPKQLAKVMQEPVARAALRTASQVAFLVRRHRADRAEYLRNKDASMTEAERRGLVAHPVALVCDNVRSAYNVGSIFRSADTARVAEVITCGFTPHPGGHGEDKVRKTGFGSVDAVAHRHFEDPSEAVRSLKAAGAFVCALETTDNASSLFDVRFPLPPAPEGKARPKNASAGDAGTAGGGDVVRGSFAAEDSENDSRAPKTDGGAVERLDGGPRGGLELEGGGVVALVLGNEVTGVDERVLGLCDLVVEVPVFGLKNSLNVASAGTVVLYEVLRQWSVAGRLAGSGD